MPPIPVLFVANWPEVQKGGQVNLMRLLERIDRRRFAATVLVAREGSLARRARELGAGVEILPITRMEPYRVYALATNLLPVVRLRRLLSAHGIRAVYVDSADHLPPVWLACRGTRARVVWHVQTGAATPLDRALASLATGLICCSHAAAARFREVATPRVVVPNSVDGERFSPGPAEARPSAGGERLSDGARVDRVRLLYLGELARSKGLHDLLAIVAEARRELPGLELRLAGRGSRLGERLLRLHARALGLDGAVRWLGHVQAEAALRACDLFLFFSHSEGLSLALLEAMATGLPILASDIPANREALADAGVTVPRSDRRAAAAALVSLCRDPARRQALGRAARERALACYPIARFVSEVERCLETWAGPPAAGEA
jgi:glycosyltransferase involved in cell wall biosynthesis